MAIIAAPERATAPYPAGLSAKVIEAALTRPPVAGGMSREVYRLPGRADLILKLERPEPPPRRFFLRNPILRRLRHFYKYHSEIRREIREYRRIRPENARTRRHLQEFHGLVTTSRGRALILSAVLGRDGGLGPNLAELLENGIDAAAHQALDVFLDWLLASRIVVADIHPGNLVLDEVAGVFVLVDGIGDKTFLPVRAWFPWLNHRYKHRLAADLRDAVAVA